MKKYIIGIPSYFPDDIRDERIYRFERLLRTIGKLFPNFPVVIIAQNWKTYTPDTSDIPNELHIVHRDRLGIVGARIALQKELLKYDFDYAILMDDDIIIYGGDVEGFLKPFEEKDDGFSFNYDGKRYVNGPLQMCVISKYILKQEPLNPKIDPQTGVGYEDVVYCWYLHCKYPDNEIWYPGETCFTIFISGQIFSSTWGNKKTEQKISDEDKTKIKEDLSINTVKICEFISKNKKYPKINIRKDKIHIEE